MVKRRSDPWIIPSVKIEYKIVQQQITFHQKNPQTDYNYKVPFSPTRKSHFLLSLSSHALYIQKVRVLSLLSPAPLLSLRELNSYIAGDWREFAPIDSTAAVLHFSSIVSIVLIVFRSLAYVCVSVNLHWCMCLPVCMSSWMFFQIWCALVVLIFFLSSLLIWLFA